MISKSFQCRYFAASPLDKTKSLISGDTMIRIILTIYLFIGTVVSANEIRWIQLETLPSIVRAKEATSRLSTTLNEKVNIFFLDDGWYAVSLGPYDFEEAFDVLNTKLSANLISSDSFVTDGKNYGKKVLNILHESKRNSDMEMTNRSCGLHVHLDAHDLDGTDIYWIVKRYRDNETTIDNFMPPSRRGNYQWCSSIDSSWKMRMLKELNTIESEIL